jgi:hypothetical protein
MDILPAGTLVERINSPLGTLVPDKARGLVWGEPLQASNGTLGYFVRFVLAAEGSDDDPVIFCAASRLRAIEAGAKS